MIELTIAQNVIVEHKLAPIGKRMFAQIIDLAVIFIFWVFYFAFLERYVNLSQYFPFFLFLSLLCYYTLFESLNKGQTIGKMALNLQVVDEQGEILTVAQTLLRAILLFIDLFFSSSILGIILMTATQKRQRLGDLAANTLVVEKVIRPSKSLLDNYSEQVLYNREAQFANVRFLKENDVMMLKDIIERQHKYKNNASDATISVAYKNICEIVGVKPAYRDANSQVYFLTEVIKDYIVATR